ncbi:ADP-ribosylglycohydrolase [Corynespora cassiicola Philippines]|uniref:ADP-ribosylglycohydrolase n=1 Tax=Corynespora cassiicola Philippines TaxID=1448308 RepID=A0A2T2P4K2_CORCC|nr:ADP-ribosylglycohydrolase [Corynespora cassiicola Philippines]
MAPLPPDYLHKIYAGVLGKLIGVYLGRPFENWTYQEILEQLGPIHYYVHEQLGVPLVVIDDDVSGTFAFVRALEEHGAKADLSPEEIGKTWLNTVIEKKTIFWWGGNGISTEHTTFLNLKKGIKPPFSGSMKTNGKTLAEQIGAQIFIDGWAMVAPGNPSLAARLSEAAAKVSHDGVAVHAAILWAVMEAEAFVSKDVDHLLDTGLSFVPKDSPLVRLVSDIRSWANEDGNWEMTRQRIEDNYGYDKYGGICHMIPNHGIMIMALIYGGHDFSSAMHIINTSGWDTDCNSGNVACLVAIMHGIQAFENEKGLDWRGPLADRAIISSADNGYSINDAARITYDLANVAAKLAGEKLPEPPKDGAQFHFSLPGSVQGFQTSASPNLAQIKQVNGDGEGALAIQIHGLSADASPIEALTETFTPLDILQVNRDYEMMASPLIYPGQTLTATIKSPCTNPSPVSICLRLKSYSATDTLLPTDSPSQSLSPGASITLTWTIPTSLQNQPIQKLGLAISHTNSSSPFSGSLHLTRLSWSGTPHLTLTRPAPSLGPAKFWQRAWVSSVDKVHTRMGPSFYLAHDRGEGVFTQGTREWCDYRVVVSGFMVNLGGPVGVVVRMRGLMRWYGVWVRRDGQGKGWVEVVKARDEERRVLASAEVEWELDVAMEVEVKAEGEKIWGKVMGVEVEGVDVEYQGGAAGFVVTEGSVSADSVKVAPV